MKVCCSLRQKVIICLLRYFNQLRTNNSRQPVKNYKMENNRDRDIKDNTEELCDACYDGYIEVVEDILRRWILMVSLEVLPH